MENASNPSVPFDAVRPSYQDADGNPCERGDPRLKYTVIGRIRTSKDGKPQALVGGDWVDADSVNVR